jgi:GrpB-like predicted nucleotidyltransferase (UPF0157 family)
MVRKVIVSAYDPAWVAAFEKEALVLRGLLGEEIVRLHHIGSTSVPGMFAKPIVDLMVEVVDILRIDRTNQRMEDAGYIPRGELGIPGRRYFVKGTLEERSFHIHCYQAGDFEVTRHLVVRDYLCAFPDEAAAYSALKVELAEQFPEDIDAYVSGKEAFVAALERRALVWAGVRRE